MSFGRPTIKWEKTSLPVVCLSLRLSTFEAGAAQVRGAASSHSTAEKRIMPCDVVIALDIGRIMEAAVNKIEMELGDCASLRLPIYSSKMRSGLGRYRTY